MIKINAEIAIVTGPPHLLIQGIEYDSDPF